MLEFPQPGIKFNFTILPQSDHRGPSTPCDAHCRVAWRAEHGSEYDFTGICGRSSETDLDTLESEILSRPGATIFKRFEHQFFKGLSVVSRDESIASLLEIAGVDQAWQAGNVILDIPEVSTTLKAAQDQPEGEDVPSASTYDLHHFTGVDKVHSGGILGEGVKVAVIDTGIFYKHPALGGGYGPGFKVAGGYDLVGGGYPTAPINPDNDPYPETRDPELYQNDHGTHVAGIIAGKSDWFTGVAPEATLLSYKVFGHTNVGDEEVFIDAFLKAYDDGADIISASIGSPGGFSDNAWATVASTLVDQGMVVIVAAGNSGRSGPFLTDTGASGKNVIAVAAIEAPHKPGDFHVTTKFPNGSGGTKDVIMPMMTNSDPAAFAQANGLPIWSLGRGFTACDELPSDVPNLGSSVVLVSQADCPYGTKVKNLVAKNAQYILFYNDNKSAAPLNLVDPNGGKPTHFTNWGTLYDLDVKPSVAAYGGHIWSTAFDWPGQGDFVPNWKCFGGTSFATPYVAGIAALWISRYGGRSVHGPGFAKELANRIISSGRTVSWGLPVQDDDAPNPHVPPATALAPVSQIGSGLIDAWKILTYTTSLNFEAFALNDTAHFRPKHSIQIKNGAQEAVTYSFGHQPLTAYEARGPQALFIAAYNQLKTIDLEAEVALPGEITLGAGETATVEFTFTRPVYADEFKMPCYSGKVLVKSSVDEELAVPYFGVAFDLKEQFPLMLVPGTPTVESLGAISNYTFEWFDKTYTTPQLAVELLYGTRELRFDFFEDGWTESNWVYPPVVGQNGYIGSALDNWEVLTRQTPTHRYKFPMTNYARSPTRAVEDFTSRFFSWQGEFTDGSWIQPGTYKIRVAALRPFGDPCQTEDWDVWNAPPMVVKFAEPIEEEEP
ncbi:unnamed protein product [Parascedosporium putredinis]|uniref:Minor extracellular protease vpr n=1 Tax=Parascedosporium putredinis TaxID=1442378 RepID=A0A9P1H3Z5_9PEZI|nr:unnamed protein product [Parascedosporium putredinis]CAI7996184.1 unnamed protein product [Parascedosporium putredinis]